MRTRYGFQISAGYEDVSGHLERDGERLFTYSAHAEDEAGALARAEETFTQHPEMDFDRSGATVRVRVITFPLRAEDDY